MNKKGDFGNFTIIFSVCFIIFLICMVTLETYFFIDEQEALKLKKESCNKINMEYYYTNSQTFCIDKNNKAHYVKIECNRLGFKKYNCNPRLISIGEIRTVAGD